MSAIGCSHYKSHHGLDAATLATECVAANSHTEAGANLHGLVGVALPKPRGLLRMPCTRIFSPAMTPVEKYIEHGGQHQRQPNIAKFNRQPSSSKHGKPTQDPRAQGRRPMVAINARKRKKKLAAEFDDSSPSPNLPNFSIGALVFSVITAAARRR